MVGVILKIKVWGGVAVFNPGGGGWGWFDIVIAKKKLRGQMGWGWGGLE